MVTFESMDEDGNGLVDKAEYMFSAKDALNAEGKEEKAFRKSVFNFAQQLYEACDLDGDGMLSPLEYEYSRYLSVSEARAAAQRGGLAQAEYDFSRRKAEELLGTMDKDGDGVVDEAELSEAVSNALRPMQPFHRKFERPPVGEWTSDVFATADVNGDGALGSRELHLATFLVNSRCLKELGAEILAEIDADGDGVLDRSEIEASLAAPDAGTSRAVRERLSEGFASADLNGDGHLQEEERNLLIAQILAEAISS